MFIIVLLFDTVPVNSSLLFPVSTANVDASTSVVVYYLGKASDQRRAQNPGLENNYKQTLSK